MIIVYEQHKVTVKTKVETRKQNVFSLKKIFLIAMTQMNVVEIDVKVKKVNIFSPNSKRIRKQWESWFQVNKWLRKRGQNTVQAIEVGSHAIEATAGVVWKHRVCQIERYVVLRWFFIFSCALLELNLCWFPWYKDWRLPNYQLSQYQPTFKLESFFYHCFAFRFAIGLAHWCLCLVSKLSHDFSVTISLLHAFIHKS